jgi:hypothetical protein
MKLVPALLSALLFVACASAPAQHVDGRYAIVVESTHTVVPTGLTTTVRDALAERLGSVDIVADRDAAATYDGVIVLSFLRVDGGNGPDRIATVRPDQGRVVEKNAPAPQMASGETYSRTFGGPAITYSVYRGGRHLGDGAVRLALPFAVNGMVTAARPSESQDELVASAKTLASDVAKKLARS